MGQDKIWIETDRVIKQTEPELMRVEVEKTRRAREIGSKYGLFMVPEVLSYDEIQGVAVFQRLDVQPISVAVKWGEPRKELAQILGRSLAVIHRELRLPEEMHVPLPGEMADAAGEVWLHGDVSVDNVCVGPVWPPIVILDWQMTPLYGGKATYGTRFFDIFWFISNLVQRPYTRFIYSNPVLPVALAFIASYFQEAGIPFNSVDVRNYADRFFHEETPRAFNEIRQRSRGRARLLIPFSKAILRDLLAALDKLDLDRQ